MSPLSEAKMNEFCRKDAKTFETFEASCFFLALATKYFHF